MFDAAKRWFKRNRANLLIGASVIGAGYVAGQYVLSKLQESRLRMGEERIAKENLRRRFQQNQEDCTYTVLALLPTVRDEIVTALPVEQLSEQLQQERQERLKRLGASEAGSSEYPSAAPSLVNDDGRSLAESMQGSFVHASQMVGSNAELPTGTGAGAAPRVKRSKAQLWQDMKINSVTRALTLIYTLNLLTLLTRIQLNLLGRRTYLSSVVALASPPNPAHASTISLENNDDDNYENAYGNDFETNRKYLTFSWWLLHRGSRRIMERVMAAVKEVFGQVNIREDVTLESLADLIMKVRRIVEGASEEERRSTKWLDYLLPPKEDEIFVIRQSGTSSPSDSDEAFSPEQRATDDPLSGSASQGFDEHLINKSLRRLLDETADLIESPTFSFVLTRTLDATFSHLVDHRIASEAFHFPLPPSMTAGTSNELAPMQPRITELPTTKVKIAHILPTFCKQAHAIALGNGELDVTLAGVAAQGEDGVTLGNEYLAAVDRVPDLEAFAALVYSSNWEYEPPEHHAGSKETSDSAVHRTSGQQVLRVLDDDELDLVEAIEEEEVVVDGVSVAPLITDTTIEESQVFVHRPVNGENSQRAASADPTTTTTTSIPEATIPNTAGLEAAWHKATATISAATSTALTEFAAAAAPSQSAQPSSIVANEPTHPSLPPAAPAPSSISNIDIDIAPLAEVGILPAVLEERPTSTAATENLRTPAPPTAQLPDSADQLDAEKEADVIALPEYDTSNVQAAAETAESEVAAVESAVPHESS